MIKGKYVALIEIEFAYEEEKLPGVFPFEQMKKSIKDDLSVRIQSILQDEVEGLGAVKVIQQLSDLYHVEEEAP